MVIRMSHFTIQQQELHMTSTSQPAKRFKLGSITVTLWPNADRHGRRFYTTTITRRTRDHAGRWNDAASLRHADMPVVAELTARAREWMTANPIREERGPPEPQPARQSAEADERLDALCAFIQQQFTR